MIVAESSCTGVAAVAAVARRREEGGKDAAVNGRRWKEGRKGGSPMA